MSAVVASVMLLRQQLFDVLASIAAATMVARMGDVGLASCRCCCYGSLGTSVTAMAALVLLWLL
jgi:hypothetical protein